MKGWFINVKRKLKTMKGFTQDRALKVGSRVTTKLGKGQVVGGAVCVKYDEGTKGLGNCHPNDRTWTHYLDDLELER